MPFPPPEELPDPGIKSRSPALQADSLPSEPPEGAGDLELPQITGHEATHHPESSPPPLEVPACANSWALQVRQGYLQMNDSAK